MSYRLSGIVLLLLFTNHTWGINHSHQVDGNLKTPGVGKSVKALCRGIAPENDMYIGVNDRRASGINKETFDAVLDQVDAYYRPILDRMGKNLVIKRNWTDGTVNAYAEQIENTWQISMFGGLARHQYTTRDSFAMVACHEMGHHMGGAPKYGGGIDWASNEGQSDYYAALKCMRFIFSGDDNEKIISKGSVDPLVEKQCRLSFSTPPEQALCIRTSMAGRNLSWLLNDLSGSVKKPSFNKPDTKKVSQTYDDHPKAQCRLDTYFNASVCTVSADIPVSHTDYRPGTCIENAPSKDQLSGKRPRCWFKPD